MKRDRRNFGGDECLEELDRQEIEIPEVDWAGDKEKIENQEVKAK